MIGYYVHHHGRGHLARAACVAAASPEPVVALSSLPEPTGHPFAGWLALAPDPALALARDAGAGGALHWAPLDAPGYAQRMAQLAGWVATARPRLLVVDVSVEVAALVRLLGVPVVVVAGAGDRGDAAHTLAYRLAARIIAPWPQAVYDPPHLVPFATKTVFTGAFARFDERVADPAVVADAAGPGRVLVLLGSGGTDVAASDVTAAQAACSGWTWSGLGGTDLPWTDDVWRRLHEADVVVTHAGLAALAEVAAARRAAVVVPQDRPFDEQRSTAQGLRRADLAEVTDTWPEPERWPAVLSAARRRGGRGWSRWNDGAGAARFARCLTDVLA